MPKEKSFNPAAAQRKADKQKEIAKSKKQVQAQRNEKLARRNPDRIQKQIDELKELEQRGALRPKDRETLAQLEKDVRGVRRAREALGEKAPVFGGASRGGEGAGGRKDVRQEQRERREQQQQQHLGKRRRRDDEDAVVSEDEAEDGPVDPEVLRIPMPRDTPPPFPRGPPGPKDSQPRQHHPLPVKPAALPPAKKVYSSAPQLRDLKKEAVRFMPSAVTAQMNRIKGQGRLLEPEEIDRLEKSGYMAAQKAGDEADREATLAQVASETRVETGEVDEEDEMQRFDEEIAQIYSEEPKDTRPFGVQIEEVEDEGD